MEKIPQTLKDYVLVSIEKEYLDAMKNTTLDLVIDPEFNPEKYRQTTGIVVSLPRRITCGAAPVIEVGDKIHFHYNAIDTNAKLAVDGKNYYRIAYWDILCIERSTTLIPVAGWVLCDPIEGVRFDLGGIEAGSISTSGIISEIMFGGREVHDTKRAIVRYTDKPLAGQPELDLQDGDVVYYSEAADFDNNENFINGHKYFYIRQEDILAKEGNIYNKDYEFNN